MKKLKVLLFCCLLTVLLCACGKNYDGKYKLTELNGISIEKFVSNAEKNKDLFEKQGVSFEEVTKFSSMCIELDGEKMYFSYNGERDTHNNLSYNIEDEIFTIYNIHDDGTVGIQSGGTYVDGVITLRETSAIYKFKKEE